MKDTKRTILTGVKPTGIPHVGNLFGAIRPAIELGADYLFIADYHALTTVKDAKTMRGLVKELACAWLACGLDPKRTVFYKQSDVSEIFEIFTIVQNITPKGELDRSHAYKAAMDEGQSINMGLYNYPILMSADILAFDTTHVPVGKDQEQHLENAKHIARAFNAIYGQTFTVPESLIEKSVATIPGLDGRKMSKSYGNQIPLFAPANELKKHIMRITTDSSLPSEPKPTDHVLFQLYSLFATKQETDTMAKRFLVGIGWGDVKKELYEVANRELTPMREKFDYYMANYAEVEKILSEGAGRARKKAQATLERVKIAVGI
ncbi:MAG: tryptophan--tRNA ligase [Firmicutes bacterium]|nr:tryptophan--tRNA ligase [Bacillota bacterium]